MNAPPLAATEADRRLLAQQIEGLVGHGAPMQHPPSESTEPPNESGPTG